MYWTVKYAFMTKTEISRFPPPFYPHQPTFASFYNIFGFDYKAGDGTIFKASGQASQIVLGASDFQVNP
jgi:multiple sugar transport system permease protein